MASIRPADLFRHAEAFRLKTEGSQDLPAAGDLGRTASGLTVFGSAPGLLFRALPGD